MLKKNEFDTIIRENINKNCVDNMFGYRVIENEVERCYENYYTEAEFEKFKKEMQTSKYIDHYNRYASGKGSELERKKG